MTSLEREYHIFIDLHMVCHIGHLSHFFLIPRQHITCRNDQFHFMNFQKSGDITLEIRINSFYPLIHDWQKGGLMIRESLATGSRHYSYLVTGSNGLSTHWRSTTNQITEHNTKSSETSKPVYLQVTKEGSSFTSAYKYEEDDEWIAHDGPRTINFDELESDEFYVGIAVSSHSNGALVTLEAEGFVIIDDDEPSSAPSERPSNSAQPSQMPSISNMPSFNPSLSSQPSEAPSLSSAPSEKPSISTEPSQSPSNQPSIQPSMQPSMQPSLQPSNSVWPSQAPSVSAQPSQIPSISGQPSQLPSISSQPSLQPSSSVWPSGIPSVLPSSQPSQEPSISTEPSQSPSNQPSMQPSMQPSGKSEFVLFCCMLWCVQYEDSAIRVLHLNFVCFYLIVFGSRRY